MTQSASYETAYLRWLDSFPEQSPFTLDKVFDDEWWPDAADGDG